MENLIDQYVSVNASVCHGKPCFKGTRIMIYIILEMLGSGASTKEIQEAYPDLTPTHIKAALHYAARVLEKREFDPSFLKEEDEVFNR